MSLIPCPSCTNQISTEATVCPRCGRPMRQAVSGVDTGLEQLQLLFNYTKSHIGLYTTIAIIFAALLASEKSVFHFHRGLLLMSVIFICVAGFAGGIIASSCAHFTSRNDLWATRIGPSRCKCLEGEYWTYVEHTAFWAGIVTALLSVLIGCSKWLPLASCPA